MKSNQKSILYIKSGLITLDAFANDSQQTNTNFHLYSIELDKRLRSHCSIISTYTYADHVAQDPKIVRLPKKIITSMAIFHRTCITGVLLYYYEKKN